MKKLLLSITILSFIFSISVKGQIFEKKEAEKRVPGSKLVRLDERHKRIKYIQLKDNYFYSATNPVNWLNSALQFTKNHSVKVLHNESDKKGFSHVKYQIYYKNTPIEGSVYTVHTIDGRIHSASGEYFQGGDISVTPSLTEQDAFQKAIKYVNASRYNWDALNSSRPTGALTILPVDSSYVLTYKFDIYAAEPLSRQYVFVNANSGEIVKTFNRIHIIDATGTAKTMYNGNVSITTDSYNGSYRLRETGRGGGIETYNLNHGSSYASATDFTDADNNWTDTVDYNHAANDAHYATEATFDYYYSKFGRNSYDNNGSKIMSYVHYSRNYVNAFWDGACMTYGDGDGINYLPLTPIEVVGHEITHGVTEHTAGLIYSGESGALNESFSDIFGVVIDFFKNPTRANYLMGDAMSVNHIPFRSMQNPNAYGDPDTYHGLYWDPYEEVHVNSGVQNFWFYLLCEGGSGTNDLGNTYNVSGIGREKGAQIAYRLLTVYLTPSSNYADARFYSIQAAIDLFGDCSAEVIAVTNAWYAVGVGTRYDNSVVADFITSKLNACDIPATICFYNRSSKASSYMWNFGDGISDTARNPVHTYNNSGNFTASLIATGNTLCNHSDTAQKTIHVSQGQSPANPSCIPHTLNPGLGGIFAFQFNTITKITNGSIDNYQDYSCTDTTYVTEGRKYKVSVKIGDSNLENIYIWIDLNNNGSFDTGEMIYQKNKVSKIFSDSLIFPGGALFNTPLRLRIGTDIATYPLTNACTNTRYGQFQDYTVYVRQNTSVPLVMFSVNKKNIVSGDTVQFKDYSLNLPSSWNWSFPGGSPSSSTSQNPMVSYSTPGIYNVTLIAANSYGSDTTVKIGYIVVTTPAPVGLTAYVTNQLTGEVNLKWYQTNDDNVFEDFDDGVADNFIFSDTCFSVSNGLLKSYGSGDASWKSARYERDFQDFLLEYKIQQIQGGSYNTGVFVRASGFMNKIDANGYLIAVLPSGSYGVWKETNGSYTNLIPWKTTSAINTLAGAWNIVNIEAIGPVIKIYVNSQYVDEFNDNTYPSGKINLQNYAGTNFDIRWDYFNIIHPNTSLTTLNLPKAINTVIDSEGTITNSPLIVPQQNKVDSRGIISQINNTQGANVFNYYKVYRDSVLLKTTRNTYSTDTLPRYGTYKYFVTSMYDEGESTPTNKVSIKWEEMNPGENCLNAQNLTTLTSPYSGSTIGYKSDFTICNMGYSPDRIFYIDVPNGNCLKIGQTYNDYDSRYSIRVGGNCPGTTEIACIDEPDIQTHTYTNSTGSTQRVYFILAGYGSSYGNFTLAWDLQAPAKPTADFSSNQSFIAPGTSVYFSDLSRGIPTSWKWSFPGGSPSTSTLQNPIVTYNNLGTYNVKLVVSNALGTDSVIKTGFITVSNLIYCKSYLNGQGFCPGDITGVSITGTTLNNTNHNSCSTLNSSTYGSYPVNGSTTAILKTDTIYELSVITSHSDIISVWIDYNQNGIFEAWEWTQVATASVANVPCKVSVDIPATALTGQTGMRIRSRAAGNTNGATDACSSFYSSGITEDYFITIVKVPKKPVANFASKQAVIAGENVQFVDLSNGIPSSWKWYFSGGSPSTSTLQYPLVSYSSSGKYDVKLIVSNAMGADSIIKTGYINVAASLPGEGCSNAMDLALLTSPYSGTTTGYKSDFSFCYLNSPDRIFYIDVPDGTILNISLSSDNFDSRHSIRIGGTCPGNTEYACVDDPDNQMHKYSNNSGSTQRVYFIVGGFSSNYGDFTLAWELMTPAIPIANFTANNTTIQMLSNVNFTDLTSGTPSYWKWYFAGGSPSVSNSTAPSVYYNSPGTYDVKLVVSNSLGSDSITKTGYIRVTPPPPPIARINASPVNTKAGSSVYFYDNSSNYPTQWKWSFTGGTPSSSTSSSASVLYNTPGRYDVKLVVANAGGSDSTIQIGFITVTALSKAVANFYTNTPNVTTGTYVSFIDNSANFPTSWRWSFAGGTPSSSSSGNPYIKYNTPGIYDVKLVVSNTIGADSIIKTGYIKVTPYPKPLADFTVNTTTVSAGSYLSFTDLSTNSPSSWKWTFNGGTPSTSNSTFPYIAYNTPGTYDVKLVVSGEGGSDSITKTNFINVVTSLPGDNCSNAQNLADLTSPYSGSTAGYKSDFSYCNMNSPERIFYIDVPNGKTLNIGQISNDFDTRHTIRIGGNCPGTTELVCVDDPDIQTHTYNNTSGSTQRVYFILGGYSSYFGNFTIVWSISGSGKPTASFMADQTHIKPGNYVYFTDQSTGNPTSWHWYFPGGSPNESTSRNPSVYYTLAGTYTVKLSVSNSSGTDSVVKKDYIVVSLPAKPIANFYASPTKINTGSRVYFYDNSLNSPTSWIWTFTGGTPSSSTSSNPTVVYNTPGLYTAKLIVSNAGGSDTIIRTQYITVVPQPMPIANFYTNNTTVVIGTYVSLYSNSGNDPTSWTWTFPGGSPSTSTSSNPSVYYNIPGTYDIKLKVSNASGSDSITKTGYIKVTLPPKPVANFYANVTNTTTGNSISFYNSSTNNPTSYKWTFTGGLPSTSTSSYPYTTYNTPGIYDVKLVVTNAGGSDSITKTGYITIIQQPKPVPNFYANTTNISTGSSVSFYSSTTNNPTSWKWTFTGGSPSYSTSSYPYVTYNKTGVYSVKLVVANTGGSDSITKTDYITVIPPPKPKADFYASTTIASVGTTVYFYNNSTNNPTSWRWSFPGGSPSTSTLSYPYVTYNSPGTYSVSLAVTNAGGTDSITKTGYITVLTTTYCTSNLGGSGSCPGDISNVLITGTTLNNVAHNNCSTSNGSTYGIYPASGSTTAILESGVTYELSVTTSNADIVSVWIDYNQNGSFEASEWQQVTVHSTTNVASKINITVPQSALHGVTRMRIRSRAYGNNNGSGDACSNFGSGIAEDYTLTIGHITKDFIANKTKICENDTIQFSNLSSGQTNTYAWDFGTGAVPKTASTAGPHMVVYNSSGSKTVSLVLDGFDSIVKTKYISIIAKPKTPIISQDQNKLLSNYEIGNQWYSTENGLLTGANSNVFNPLSNGNYYSVVTEDGCVSSSSNTIHFIPNSLEKIKVNSLTFYPNPFGEFLNIKADQEVTISKIEVRNALGTLVLNVVPVNKKGVLFTLDLSKQACGYYTILLYTEQGLIINKMLKVN